MATFKQLVGGAAIAAIALSSAHSSLDHALHSAPQHAGTSRHTGSTNADQATKFMNDSDRIMASIDADQPDRGN